MHCLLTLCVLSMTVLSVETVTAELLPGSDRPLNSIEKLDLRIKRFAQAHQSDTGNRFFGAARLFGDWRLYLAATGAMFVDKDQFGELALKGGVINVAATESLRRAVGRVRPRKTESPAAYRLPKGNSFPSGHTSGAFALATALDENYGVGYAAYPVAAMTALSRIYHDAHWFSDTLMGAAIGVTSMKAVALHDEEGLDYHEGADAYFEAFGAYTVADVGASRLRKSSLRTGVRLAAIGFMASRVEEEADLYGAFAGVATSLLMTRGLKRFRALRFGPSSVSLAWEW